MDATIVRATLVPAFMRLAGEANWWAPRWMQRFQQRYGLHEFEEDAPALPHGVQPVAVASVGSPGHTVGSAAGPHP